MMPGPQYSPPQLSSREHPCRRCAGARAGHLVDHASGQREATEPETVRWPPFFCQRKTLGRPHSYLPSRASTRSDSWVFGRGRTFTRSGSCVPDLDLPEHGAVPHIPRDLTGEVMSGEVAAGYAKWADGHIRWRTGVPMWWSDEPLTLTKSDGSKPCHSNICRTRSGPDGPSSLLVRAQASRQRTARRLQTGWVWFDTAHSLWWTTPKIKIGGSVGWTRRSKTSNLSPIRRNSFNWPDK